MGLGSGGRQRGRIRALPRGSVAHAQAAVHRQHGTGHVGGTVGEHKVRHRGRHLVGAAQPAPAGTWAASASTRAGPVAASIGVSIGPGATAFTVMKRVASFPGQGNGSGPLPEHQRAVVYDLAKPSRSSPPPR